MKIKRHKCYLAKVNYDLSYNIPEGCPNNGEEIIVQCLYKANKKHKFPKDWIFQPSKYNYNLPQRVLTIIKEVDSGIFGTERWGHTWDTLGRMMK